MLTHTRRTFLIALALPLLTWATVAPAQWLPEPAEWIAGDAELAAAPAVPSWGGEAGRGDRVEVDEYRVVITSLGAVGGFTAGALIGAVGITAVASMWPSRTFRPPYAGGGHILEHHDIAAGAVMGIGAMAGAVVGAPVGAHVANGRRGTLWAGVLGSVAATTTTAWLITRRGDGVEVIVALPLMSIGSAAAIELLITR